MYLYIFSKLFLTTDYATISARKISLKGIPFSEEFARLGAYRDAWNNKIKCHNCDLIFQIQEIFTLMKYEGISFEDAM